MANLRSDAARGLDGAEAKRRLEQYGPNQLKSAPETPWWKRLLEQFENFLVIILLVAIVISVIEWLLQDPRESALPYEAIVITAIVVLNALLGYFQEARAERSVRALMALAAPESTVIRDGERQRVAAHEVVPGDIVLIEAGDKIPADGRIIEEANLQTDEAPLTGESLPVTKSSKPLDADASLGDRANMIFSGTVVTYGRGRAVIVATGMETEVGRIAGLLEAAEKEPTPLQQELDRTGKPPHRRHARHLRGGVRRRPAQHADADAQCRAEPVPVRGCARGRRDPGGLAGHRDGGPQPRRAAYGGGQCHRAQAAGDRDARRRNRDLLRQDRHADAQRDDGARDRHQQRPDRCRRQRLHPRGRIQPSRQAARDKTAGPRGGDAHAACGGAGQRCGADRERGSLEGPGRPDGGCLDRRGSQARPDRA